MKNIICSHSETHKSTEKRKNKNSGEGGRANAGMQKPQSHVRLTH